MVRDAAERAKAASRDSLHDLALRVHFVLGLPEGFTGHVVLHFHEGRPTRREVRDVGHICDDDVDPKTATNVA